MASEPRATLAGVRWLGGAAGVGKTTLARRLARDHHLRLLSCDERFADHRRRADPRRHPAFFRLAERDLETLAAPPVTRRVTELLAFYRDQLAFLLDDLRALPPGPPVLVEGVGLLPELIAPRLETPSHALWLLAHPRLRRRRCRARFPELDPRPARRLARRDDAVARHLELAARERGLAVLRLDGRWSPVTAAARVAQRLGLPPAGAAPRDMVRSPPFAP